MTDGMAPTALLHDLPEDDEELYAAALVASGDYFVTLAATLEEIACSLPETHAEQHRLQYLIGQLLYLQRHYKIRRKNTTSWQH